MKTKNGKAAASGVAAPASNHNAAKGAKRGMTREAQYRKVFESPAPAAFMDANEFIPQVHGYGEPTFAMASAFPGV